MSRVRGGSAALRVGVGAAVVVLGFLAVAPRASSQTKEAPMSVASLDWLAGSWESATGKGESSEEHWMAPRGGAMYGMARSLKEGRAVFHEFLAIEEQPSGEVLLTVRVRGAKDAVAFKLTRQGEREAVFENPQHDFPQRIVYRRVSEGELRARVEAGEGASARGMDIEFRRGKLAGD